MCSISATNLDFVFWGFDSYGSISQADGERVRWISFQHTNVVAFTLQ
jgi:hypothetical protein